MIIERHPLEPFLPQHCRVLFLGSFPPQRKRWCMDFFYPNWINDHWRIEGLVWFGNKDYFVDAANKSFRLEKIKAFLNEKGIGFYDTATAVRRLADNASDKFLEIVEPTDIDKLIAPLKELQAIAVTGEKACTTICDYYHLTEAPKTGASIFLPNGLRLYRLPSSSRAYPLSLEKKAAAYQKMFAEIFGNIVENSSKL
ncbi:MAG: uracil-DNA glycosylase family protein [Bacteroidaceae bacterium]|nr:uracil-DNA glycosylase family protein [Bacteroidaceae bacterium]